VDIEVASANVVDVYHLLVGIVTPRPIAWVSSISTTGLVNLAPFSFFNVFGANPPIVVFSPTLRRDGSKKDTLRNVEATREFVINSVTASLAEKANLSSSELPSDVSEIELTRLSTLPAQRVKPPRLKESPVSLECVVRDIMCCGTGPIAANLVIGEVLYMHIDDRILDEHKRVDPRKLQTVARLGQDYWCHTSDLFELKRP
jgi:flavin reductase (DIM6/NTAB) family NADH-FMN oxidoreductase RutF